MPPQALTQVQKSLQQTSVRDMLLEKFKQSLFRCAATSKYLTKMVELCIQIHKKKQHTHILSMERIIILDSQVLCDLAVFCTFMSFKLNCDAPFDPHVRHIFSWRLSNEKLSTATLPLPLIQEQQLPVTGKRMCTKNW